MIRKFLRYILKSRLIVTSSFLLTTIAIILLTMLPPERLGSSDIYQYDLAGHFLIFLVWTFLFGLMIIAFQKKQVSLFFIFLIGCFFGVAIEIAQHLAPFNRTADLYDALADIAGSLTAVGILKFLQTRLGLNSPTGSPKK